MTIPESEERDRIELEMLLTKGTPLVAVQGYSSEEVIHVYQRASELCESLGQPSRLVPIFVGLALHHAVAGEVPLMRRFAEQSYSMASRGTDRVHKLLAHRAQGLSHMFLGNLSEAIRHYESVVRLYDPEQDRLLATTNLTDPRAASCALLAPLWWVSGYPDRARDLAGNAFQYASEQGHLNTTGFVTRWAGQALSMLCRNVESTKQHSEFLRTFAAEHHLELWRADSTIGLGWVAGKEGRLKEGRALLEEGSE